jgi:hypothetical protein
MKFRTNRKHLPAPVPIQQHHPLYYMQSKRHFEPKFSDQMEWRSSIRKLPAPPLTDGRENLGMRKLIEDITIVKPKIERMHFMGSRGHSTLQQHRRDTLLKPSESVAVVGS